MELNDPAAGVKVKMNRERQLRKMAEEDLKVYRKMLKAEQEQVKARIAEAENERRNKNQSQKSVEVFKDKFGRSQDEVGALKVGGVRVMVRSGRTTNTLIKLEELIVTSPSPNPYCLQIKLEELRVELDEEKVKAATWEADSHSKAAVIRQLEMDLKVEKEVYATHMQDCGKVLS